MVLFAVPFLIPCPLVGLLLTVSTKGIARQGLWYGQESYVSVLSNTMRRIHIAEFTLHHCQGHTLSGAACAIM